MQKLTKQHYDINTNKRKNAAKVFFGEGMAGLR